MPPATSTRSPMPGKPLRGMRVSRGGRPLAPVSFTAAPGSVTVLVGPSGIGKSSVFAALLGTADFSGSATWGERDVRRLAASTWLAWAGQRPGLSAGTVAENVALGDEEPDAALVGASLTAACADDVDPQKVLGVQGAGLSGGQAQRVAVARALYRRAHLALPVVAFDEPSAALDAETEASLWRALRAEADGGAVVLLISHRDSARAIADQVIDLAAAEVPA